MGGTIYHFNEKVEEKSNEKFSLYGLRLCFYTTAFEESVRCDAHILL